VTVRYFGNELEYLAEKGNKLCREELRGEKPFVDIYFNLIAADALVKAVAR